MVNIAKIQEIVAELETLTLLEASELVSQIEENFGVDASASSGMVMVAGNDTGATVSEEVVEEKTEFDVFLAEVPSDKKIAILKVVRSFLGLGLKEAKDLVEAAPTMVAEGITKEVAEGAQKQIEEAGGKVELK
nr:ribosomal protein L12 [Meringosphaera mediterranea]